MVRGFLEEPIKIVDIRNEKRRQYKVTPQMSSDFFKGKEDIYPNLREGLMKYLSIYADKVPTLSMLYGRVVPIKYQPITNKKLLELAISSVDLDRSEKDQLNKLYSSNSIEFFKLIFKLAIRANNKTAISVSLPKKEISLDDEDLTTKDIIDILMSKPRPITIITPDEVDESEVKYVKELLKVYSEKASVTFASKSDLEKDPSLLKAFEEQRRYFYAAESIKRGLRDTEHSGKHFFDDYKDEVFEGIKEATERTYTSGEDKLNSILDRVTLIPLNSFIAKIPDWITATERKGTCHMLVNDGKVTWNKDVKE